MDVSGSATPDPRRRLHGPRQVKILRPMAARHGRLGWAFLGAVIVKDGEIIGRPIVDRAQAAVVCRKENSMADGGDATSRITFPARPPTILAASARTIQSDPPTASRRRDRACAAVPESLARPATRLRPAGVRAPRLASFPLFILTKDQCIDTDVGVTDWPPDGKN
jgi:hypothetical protein